MGLFRVFRRMEINLFTVILRILLFIEELKMAGTQTTARTSLQSMSDFMTTSAPVSALIPNGVDNGDTALTSTSGTSVLTTESMPVRFPVGSSLLSTAFINTNGIVTFDSAYETITPTDTNQNQTDTSEVTSRVIIAPYFTNLCTSGSSGTGVTIRVYNSLSTTHNHLRTNSAVQRALQILSDIKDVTFFDIDTFMLVTWNKMAQSGNCGSTTETVTFQLALLSDGSTSYAIFLYETNQMSFSSYVDIAVGFTTNTNLHEQHAASFTSSALTMDQLTNVKGTKGVFVYKLTISPVTNYRLQCKKSHFTYTPEFNALKRIPTCPCSLHRIFSDTRFHNVFTISRPNAVCTTSYQNVAFLQYGQECCYSLGTGAYVRTAQSDSAGGLYLYHQDIQNLHYEADTLMRSVCCEQTDTAFCNLYFEIHPVYPCYVDYAFAITWIGGDPHFQTLDRKIYTFNGHGEYILLRTVEPNSAETFVLVARTGRAATIDGGLANATVFTAFAAADNNGASIHVELNLNTTGLVVYGNGQDLSLQFNDKTKTFFKEYKTNDSLPSTFLLLRRDGDGSLITTFSQSGISLKFSVGEKLLNFIPYVSDRFRNYTQGLLGNFNGDPTDDLMFPNGTVLPGSASDREIFHWGQTWMISDTESVLRYSSGMNTSSYRDDAFVPFFLDEIGAEQKQGAAAFCNETDGSINDQCVFDFLATGNKAIAVNTLVTEQEVRAELLETDNIIPSLSGSAVFNASVGDTLTAMILAVDDGTFEYIIVENTTQVTIGPRQADDSVSVSVTIEDENPIFVSVSARDNNGVIGVPIEFTITLCTGCSGHGTCDYATPREDSRATITFKYATCICDDYTSGIDCEADLDGCAVAPCSAGRSCSDVPMAQHETTGVGFNCGSCPVGYAPVDNTCEDANECATANGGCTDICENTIGSFRCSCHSGYQLISATECIDLDECIYAMTMCTQVCENTDGNYSCSCYDGYSLDSNGMSCSLVSDPCNGTIDCSQAHGCTVVDGNATCTCFIGFTLDSNNDCINTNECDGNVCAQICTDTEGSYECSCEPGYKLTNNKVECEPCPFPTWGLNCAFSCVVNEALERCDAATGTVCRAGWTGMDCTVNIDECSDDPNICGDVDKVCVNLNGTYDCRCRTGFTLADNGTCIDLNECDDVDMNVCEQTCVNIYGSFSCECTDGYATNPQDYTQCIDIDECALGTSGCDQDCENTVGSFNCMCLFGYVLQDDRRTCLKSEDPCADMFNLTCSGNCVFDLTRSTAECGCNSGYFLATDKETCIEINECENDTLNNCSQKSNCINTDGGYTCFCDAGFRLDNDLRTCRACDNNHYGENCANECNCGPGSLRCDSVLGCICAAGWKGRECRIPEDICAESTNPCTGQNEICINTIDTGTIYECRCATGYERDGSNVCVDINECVLTDVRVCQQICTNTMGSYTCQCSDGFLANGDICEDIDECSGPNECEQICYNLLGGYRCACYDGFTLDSANRRQCSPTVVCTASQIADCESKNATCSALSPEPCVCNKGYERINVSDDFCSDIKECDQVPSPCTQNCIELPGSFKCSCNDGYFLETDNKTCTACPTDKFGTNCGQDCTCVSDNTETCNSVNGTCTCRSGWRGANCDQNINECIETPTICDNVPRSTCEDTDGSFECQCEIGLFKTISGQCEVCGNFLFGENCGSACTCVQENSNSCDNVDGSCSCKTGWVGDDCDVDFDECALPVCRDNANCVNNNGSYSCVCINGYKKNIDQDCIDTDECLEGTDNCDFVCTNTVGGYECSCPASGYTGTGNNCTVCSPGFWGPQCVSACNCNQDNRERCDIVLGCICEPGWQGTFCGENINECQAGTSACPANSVCNDTPGSYTCSCVDGYTKNFNTMECDSCTGNTYGRGCNSSCVCVTNNTLNKQQTCNHVTGICECNQFWVGETCSEDINECTLPSDQCVSKPNSGCYNTQGGFICGCLVGYVEDQSRDCVIDTTPTDKLQPQDGEGLFSVSMTTDFELLSGENITVSQTNEDYKAKFKALLEDLYRQRVASDAVTEIVIIGIRIDDNGKLIVEYNYTSSNDEVTMAKIARFHSELVSFKQPITIDGRSAVIQTLYFQGVTVLIGEDVGQDRQACQLFEVTNQCPTNYQCIVSADVIPSCQFIEGEKTYELEIGLGVGIPLFLLLLILIIMCIICLARRRRRKDEDRRSDASEQGFFPSVIPSRFALYRPDAFYRTFADDSSSVSSERSSNRGAPSQTSSVPYYRQPWFSNILGNKFSIDRPKAERAPNRAFMEY